MSEVWPYHVTFICQFELHQTYGLLSEWRVSKELERALSSSKPLSTSLSWNVSSNQIFVENPFIEYFRAKGVSVFSLLRTDISSSG